jgi:hypothetical protein
MIKVVLSLLNLGERVAKFRIGVYDEKINAATHSKIKRKSTIQVVQSKLLL